MSKFGVSDNHKGPWRGEYKKPDQALAAGRAMWGDHSRVYIAEIAPLNIGEGLPTIGVIVGDVRETLSDKYGSGVDAVFDNHDSMYALEKWWKDVTDHIFASVIQEQLDDEDTNVAVRVKSYTALQAVKLGDWK